MMWIFNKHNYLEKIHRLELAVLVSNLLKSRVAEYDNVNIWFSIHNLNSHNDLSIWNHHSNCPKLYFQIFRKFLTASITWIL